MCICCSRNTTTMLLGACRYLLLVSFLMGFGWCIHPVGQPLQKDHQLVPWEDLRHEVTLMTQSKEQCKPELSSCYNNQTSVEPVKGPSGLCMPGQVGPPRLCSCDEDCLRYGDCCLDMAEAYWGDGREEGSERYTCRPLKLYTLVGVMMVATCLPKYRSSTVEQFCLQNVTDDQYTYLLDLPAMSQLTNISYVNYYCALCNEDHQQLYQWNITISCPTKEVAKQFNLEEFMEKAEYQPGMRMFIRKTFRNKEEENSDIHKQKLYCTYEAEEFKDLKIFAETYNGRLCTFPKSICKRRFVGNPKCPEQVDRCHPDWNDRLEIEKCSRYSMMMMHTNEKGRLIYYKNPHCAKCNFVDVESSNFNCKYKCSRSIVNKFTGITCFSALMDFRKKFDCNEKDDLWDPLHTKCNKIECGSLFKLENGECTKNQEIYALMKNSSLLDSSCPKIRIAENEYIPRKDGSIFINETKKVYISGKFEYHYNNTVLICNDYYYYRIVGSPILRLLTLIVLVISLICLLLHIAIFCVIPRHRNLPGKNLFSLTCSLFISQLLFLTNSSATHNYGLCVFVSSSMHYFWLASFCWMNVMSIDVWRTFTSQVYRGDAGGVKTYIIYSLYAWTVPLLVVTIGLMFDYTEVLPDYSPKYASKKLCWINNGKGLGIFFLLPVGLIIIENIILFFLTSFRIYQQSKAAKYAQNRSQSLKQKKPEKGKKDSYDRRSQKNRVRFLLYIKLAIVQGVSWLTGFIGAFTSLTGAWIVFTVFNGLQGLFIFAAFDMKQKVFESMWEAVTGHQWGGKHRASKDTRTTTVSSSQRSSKSYSSGRRTGVSNVSTRNFGQNICDTSDTDAEGLESTAQRRKKSSGAKADICNLIDAKQTRFNGPMKTDAVNKTTFDDTKSPRQLLKSSVRGNNTPTQQRQSVRNGDLRAGIVKGKFYDELCRDSQRGDKMIFGQEGVSQSQGAACNSNFTRSKSERCRNKPELQKVVDLLEQLQRNKNNAALPDLLQQMLRASGKDGDQRSTISKCRSFTEGTNQQLQDEQNRAMALRLKLLEYSGDVPRLENHLLASDTLPPPPAELLYPDNTQSTEKVVFNTYDPDQQKKKSKLDKSLSYHTGVMIPQATASLCRDKQIGGTLLGLQPQSNTPQQKQKSQSLSQVSQVALAVTMLQKGVRESRKLQNSDPNSQTAPTRSQMTPSRASESLV